MRTSSTIAAGGGATLFFFGCSEISATVLVPFPFADAAATGLGPPPGAVIFPNPPSMNASMSSSTFFSFAGASLGMRFGAVEARLAGGSGGAAAASSRSTTSVPSSSMSMLEISSSMTIPSLSSVV